MEHCVHPSMLPQTHGPGADSPALHPKPRSGFSFPDLSRGTQRQTLEGGFSQLFLLFLPSIWFFLCANPPLSPTNSTLSHPQSVQPSPPPCLHVDGRGDSPGLPFLLHQSQPSFRDSSQFLQDVFVSQHRHRVPYTLVSFLDTIQI